MILRFVCSLMSCVYWTALLIKMFKLAASYVNAEVNNRILKYLCPTLCTWKLPLFPLTFSLTSAYFAPPPALRPSLRVYPDSSPIMPVASDGTRVTVQTRGSL